MTNPFSMDWSDNIREPMRSPRSSSANTTGVLKRTSRLRMDADADDTIDNIPMNQLTLDEQRQCRSPRKKAIRMADSTPVSPHARSIGSPRPRSPRRRKVPRTPSHGRRNELSGQHTGNSQSTTESSGSSGLRTPRPTRSGIQKRIQANHHHYATSVTPTSSFSSLQPATPTPDPTEFQWCRPSPSPARPRKKPTIDEQFEQFVFENFAAWEPLTPKVKQADPRLHARPQQPSKSLPSISIVDDEVSGHAHSSSPRRRYRRSHSSDDRLATLQEIRHERAQLAVAAPPLHAHTARPPTPPRRKPSLSRHRSTGSHSSNERAPTLSTPVQRAKQRVTKSPTPKTLGPKKALRRGSLQQRMAEAWPDQRDSYNGGDIFGHRFDELSAFDDSFTDLISWRRVKK